MKRISLVIYAAGLSSRFGKPKLVEEINGRKVLEILIEKVSCLPLHGKYIVIRENDEVIKSIIPDGFTVLENPHPEMGMSESIKIGMKAAFRNSDGVMMLPGDQPLVTVEHILNVMNKFESSGCGIAATLCGNEIRNPAIFSKSYYSDLMKLSGDSGGRKLFEKHMDDLALIEIDDCRMLEDLDYPADLAKIRNLYDVLGSGGTMGDQIGNRTDISVGTALKLIREITWKKIRTSRIPAERSCGMISSEDVASPVNSPPYRKSAMDGYGVDSTIFDSLEDFPVQIRIAGKIGAGRTDVKLESRLDCIEIFTGGEIPSSVDCVIKYEDAKRNGDAIILERPFKKGENIVDTGEYYSKGELILNTGMIIRPAHVSALKQCMINTVAVFEKIRVSVISTGDELDDSGESGQTPDSTQPLLVNWLNRGFMAGLSRGICRDDADHIKNKVLECSKDSDMVVVTGGSGKSDLDLVKKALESVSKPVFNGVRLKPGKTIMLYDLDGVPVFSLSGLPVAALLSLIQFTDLFVNIFTGYENNNRIYGKLENEISSDPFSTSVIIARVEHTEAGNLISPARGKISGKISALLAGDAYIVMAEGNHVYKRGDTLEAHEGGW